MAHAPEPVRRKAHITVATIPELRKFLGTQTAPMRLQVVLFGQHVMGQEIVTTPEALG